MTNNFIELSYLFRKLRWKYKDKPELNKILDRICWYSFPVVYPNYNIDSSKMTKAIENRKKKKYRANAYLKGMARAFDELYFVTLTFDDKILKNTTERTRHRYAQQWLNLNCRDYYANSDYGKKNGREHFHAVVALNPQTEKWRFGFSKVRSVKKKDEPATSFRISSYITKLSNHSGKLGTGKSFHKKGFVEVDSLPF